MNLINLYYKILGENPTEEDRTATQKTFEHLLDNGFCDQDITNIFKDLPMHTKITPSDLPDKLWDGSLLKRDTFYYHSQLRIASAVRFDLRSSIESNTLPFIEMKIQYTLDDLRNYYYSMFPEQREFSEYKKDIGSLKYLLTKYSKYTFIEPIDTVLFIIDEAKNSFQDQLDIIELNNSRAEKTILQSLKQKVLIARGENCNKIMWR